MCSLPPPTRADNAHSVDVGQRVEAAIVLELVKREYDVLTPVGFNHRYDLVIDCGDRFLRAQCKTGRLRNGRILFATRSVRTNTRKVQFRGYAGEIDLFLVFCPDTDRVYAVPVEEAATTLGSLRVAPTANNQSKRVVWAADYELPAFGKRRDTERSDRTSSSRLG
jgi:PD-(D/E)XK endonuclease